MLLLPVWSVYLVCLHYHQRLSGEAFLWSDLLILCCLTLVAAAAYYINQVYDYDSDFRNDKLGFLQANILTERAMIALYISLSIVSVGAGVLLSTATFFILLLLFMIGYVYSAPPVRLKDRPVSGLLANAIGYGFLIPLSIMPDLNFHNAGLLGWDNPLYFFFAVGSIYVLTTLPDKEGDRASGKRTLAVVLPRPIVVIVALVLMLASGWVARYSGNDLLLYISAISAIFIFLMLLIRSAKFDLFAAKLPILLLTMLAAYFFPGYALFIVAMLIFTRIYYRYRFSMVYPKLT